MTPESKAPASDEQLLREAQAGGEAALAELIQRYKDKIYGFGMRMCNDPEDAKDVLQDTLMSVARSIRDFRGESSMSTWLYAIARSMCVKHRRQSKFAPSGVLDIGELGGNQEPKAGGAAPDQALDDQRVQQALRTAIQGLEPIYREVLVLRDLEGLTTPEVSKILGSSEAAIKSRLHRARASINQRLTELFGGEVAREPGCPDVVNLFSRHLEDDIEPDLCARMNAHLKTCKSCSATCNSLQRTLSICAAARPAELPAEVEREVREQLRRLVARGT